MRSNSPTDAGTARYPSPLRLARLPGTGPLVLLDGSPQTLHSGEVTLDLPSGATVEPSIEDNLDSDVVRFRALRVLPGPAAARPAFLDGIAPAALPAALYAVTPHEALLDGDGGHLAFDNAAALPPSAAVELQALGTSTLPGGPPPGTLGVVGAGHVTADGTRIVIDTPVRSLTWFGLHAKGP